MTVPIRSYDELVELTQGDVEILVTRRKFRMARVTVGGRAAMGGHFWDFHPGCHGGWFYELKNKWGGFSNPSGLAERLRLALEGEAAALGRVVNVTIREDDQLEVEMPI